jgi:hypothetical protein
MVSARDSIKKNSTLASFLSHTKLKDTKIGISPKKPPDKNTKTPNTDKEKRSASQPAPPKPLRNKTPEPSTSASQPPLLLPEEEELGTDTETATQATQHDQPEEEPEENMVELDYSEDWEWLMNKKLIEDRETVNVDDMVEVLYSLATNNKLYKDTMQKAIKATTNILVAALLAERKEWDRSSIEEEGEINTTKTNTTNTNQVLGEMKSLFQDSLLRATTALEEATKELRETRKEAHTPISAPPQDNQQPAPTPKPYAEAVALAPPSQNSTQNTSNQSYAITRAKAKARQLIFDLDENHRLLKLSNISIRDELRLAPKKTNAPLQVDIFSVRKLNKGGLLLELNSEVTGDWLRDPNNSASFRKNAGIEVDFTPRTFNILAKFMPTETFNTDNEEHLSELREENCWEKNMMIKARWAKAIENRKPGQAHAHLILTFADRDETNALLLKRGFISYHGLRIGIEKDRRIPMRCARCQMFSHIAKDCSRGLICGKCSLPDHDSQNCVSDTSRCATCKQDGHEAYSNTCPTFQRKMKDYNTRTPENTLPFYPSPNTHPSFQPSQNNATPTNNNL